MSDPASKNTRRRIESGDLAVPRTEISLSDGSTFSTYETWGPEGHSPTDGLPSRRAEWTARRVERGDTNFSQMHCARKGEITEEMAFVAAREGCSPELVRDDLARGRAI
ncbi:MAG TPA: hypothetical protein DIU15_07915, partial [Deltaproteobacteria bacterium]|nr:hypothetical protein [Deltaproteobacteria bacterium]